MRIALYIGDLIDKILTFYNKHDSKQMFVSVLLAWGTVFFFFFLGMLRSPHSPKPVVDVAAARDMIEILTMLKEKTAGNLTPDEDDFLSTHLGELKLAFVQRTKTI